MKAWARGSNSRSIGSVCVGMLMTGLSWLKGLNVEMAREAQRLRPDRLFLQSQIVMSRATRLIPNLDKALANQTSFEETPQAFVDDLVALLEKDLESVQAKNKPQHWAEIYVNGTGP